MRAPRLERLGDLAGASEGVPPLSFWQMPEKIYRLSLEWKPNDPSDEYVAPWVLEARLDGTSLLDLVREWELEHVPEQEKEIAGGYAGLQRWNADNLYEWLNEPVPGYEYPEDTERKATLLGCSCGVLDCWPLEVSVTITEQNVIWSDFLQPFRRKSWSYDGFGPFTFHRAQYEAEVRRAIANAPA